MDKLNVLFEHHNSSTSKRIKVTRSFIVTKDQKPNQTVTLGPGKKLPWQLLRKNVKIYSTIYRNSNERSGRLMKIPETRTQETWPVETCYCSAALPQKILSSELLYRIYSMRHADTYHSPISQDTFNISIKEGNRDRLINTNLLPRSVAKRDDATSIPEKTLYLVKHIWERAAKICNM